MQLRGRSAGFVRTEGGLLPADLLERIRALDRKLPGLDEASYGLAKNERFGEAITRSWNRLVGEWTRLQEELTKVPPSDPGTTTTRERWLLPLMDELGYGRLPSVKAVELDGKSYPVSHTYGTVPLHLVGGHVTLDSRTRGVAGAAGQSPHGLLQELLNRSPERLWGIVTNGRTLRILRDNASLTRQAYVEFDLEAIFDGEAYADFALLWLVAHRSRVEPRIPDKAEEGTEARVEACRLELWSKVAEETGARARDRLRDGVQDAIEALGRGFLAHVANAELKAALQSGELSTQDYYRELLRLVYRFILLFVAEDRDLLLAPEASLETRDRYTRFYSTARLRRLAERRKGSRHADLYAGLRVVIGSLGSDEGASGIGLPPLGGFLFGPEACAHLDRAELTNGDLLDAIRRLATIEERGVLRPVDYRNLGSEELGSIYESLLELHPELDTAAATFALTSAAGHERKTTGSYYTPSSLINVLLDSALDPVLAEAADKPTKEEAERAILELSVVDPAAGSGHFLVAAAHRIAKRLAQVRTADDEPSPNAIHTALRDVIGHCLYAVDINPMAVELCKVSLWLEALEPGKPLTFLDAHIKCGNSLLGTTPELIAQGIPDAAYDPIEGDDPVLARALKQRNKVERDGQLSLGEAGFELPIAALAARAREIEATSDDDLLGLRAKELRQRALLDSTEYRESRQAANTWTAAFVSLKRAGVPELTTATVRVSGTQPQGLPAEVIRAIEDLSDQYAFFHAPIEFPGVFARGGFGVVLGNPPWERVKLQEREYFAERSPEIAQARNASERKRMIVAIQDANPTLWLSFQSALRHSDGESHLLRDTGRYPLAGRGDINTYSVFVEAMRSLVAPHGRVGVIVPTGIATDDTTKFLFGDLTAGGSLISLFDMGEISRWFADTGGLLRFCLLTIGGPESGRHEADLVFFARSISDLSDSDRHFTMRPEDFALVNPNTRTSPIFKTRRDAEITKSIHSRVPVLRLDGNPDGSPWGVDFLRMFDMANDSGLFLKEPTADSSPLVEPKMVHHFNHRFGDYRGVTLTPGTEVRQLPTPVEAQLRNPAFETKPRYWVNGSDVNDRLDGRWERAWLVGWRDVAAATNERTLIASVIPRVGANHKFLLAMSADPAFVLLPALLSSFVVDWLARQRLGGMSFGYFVMNQIPMLPPKAFGDTPPWTSERLATWLRPYLAELVYTSWSVQGYGRDLGWIGPPFVFRKERRDLMRSEVDAAFFLLYGLDRDDVEHVMDSFSIVRTKDEKEHGRYRTKELILDAYDGMTAAEPGSPFVSRLVPLPGDVAVSHAPRDGTIPGGWISWDDVLRGHPPPQAARQRGPGHAAVPPASPPAPLRHARPEPGGGSAPASPASTRPEHQPSLADVLRDDDDASAWTPESSLEPSSIALGMGVRHRSFGEGKILSVRESGRTTSLLIRFRTEQREIAFGYGLLEFML